MLDCKIGAIGAPKLVPTQTPIETKRPADPAGNQKIHRVEVYWTAVTYKTVAIYVVLAAASPPRRNMTERTRAKGG